MSTVDPRRAGDVLSTGCDCRPPRHVRGIRRCSDRDVEFELRKMDDTVDGLYSAIKYYLTKISREQLNEKESRRWTDIISFTINIIRHVRSRADPIGPQTRMASLREHARCVRFCGC